MQEIRRKLAGVWQNRPENWDSADRQTRKQAKTCRYVAEKAGKRGFR